MKKAQYLLMPDNLAPDRIPPVIDAFCPTKGTCNFVFCLHVCLHQTCKTAREFENRSDINIVICTNFILLAFLKQKAHMKQ